MDAAETAGSAQTPVLNAFKAYAAVFVLQTVRENNVVTMAAAAYAVYALIGRRCAKTDGVHARPAVSERCAAVMAARDPAGTVHQAARVSITPASWTDRLP